MLLSFLLWHSPSAAGCRVSNRTIRRRRRRRTRARNRELPPTHRSRHRTAALRIATAPKASTAPNRSARVRQTSGLVPIDRKCARETGGRFAAATGRPTAMPVGPLRPDRTSTTKASVTDRVDPRILPRAPRPRPHWRLDRPARAAPIPGCCGDSFHSRSRCAWPPPGSSAHRLRNPTAVGP